MTSKQTHSDTSGSRRMAWMDWFGLIALGLLMVCSLVLLGQLLNLDMLDIAATPWCSCPAAPPRVVMPPRSAAACWL